MTLTERLARESRLATLETRVAIRSVNRMLQNRRAGLCLALLRLQSVARADRQEFLRRNA